MSADPDQIARWVEARLSEAPPRTAAWRDRVLKTYGLVPAAPSQADAA